MRRHRAAAADPGARAGSRDNGGLEAREILGLQLHADLAVLSACETAYGHIGKGEGVIGLSWAFSLAGLRNTAVSLWSVDAASTAAFVLIGDGGRDAPRVAAARRQRGTGQPASRRD